MTTEHTTTGLIGASIRRVEDAPLITGVGCYTEDIQLPGILHMALLRSPYPHAKIISINTSTAKAMAGVIAVVTGDDLSEQLSVPAIPMVPGMKIPPHPLLARGAVHAAGTPVAAVIAQSRALAHDAVSAIVVESEALPDVGGGFGSKGLLYQEDALASHLALKLGRPVKWISTRSEDFVTTNQGRDQVMTSELALKRDGTMLGLKVHVVGNLGAYLNSLSAIPPLRMMAMAPGCYQIQNCSVEVVAVFTNTIPTGPYRGAGRPESVLNIERLIDKAARALGIDCLEIRRKNFIRPEQLPYRTGVNVEYDSGDYEKSLAEALRLSDYEKLIRYRDESRKRGELVGVGLSTFVEPSGGVGFESGTVRVERTGEITVLTGSSSYGQGHEPAFAQVAAQKMGVSMDHVAIRHGDTLAVQQGVGTFGSRSAIMGGGALAIAIDRVTEKARRIAAHLMEAAAEDIVQTDGGFAVAGVRAKKVLWHQIAAAAHGGNVPRGTEPGPQETAFFDPGREAWGFGAHLALVRIDRETGTPTLEKLVLVDDCGVVINPMILNGQIHGGVAQGLGEAFREQMLFGDAGEVLTGSLMNYAVPRAGDMQIGRAHV